MYNIYIYTYINYYCLVLRLDSPIRRNTTTLNMDSKVGVTTPNITPSFLDRVSFEPLPDCVPAPFATSLGSGVALSR